MNSAIISGTGCISNPTTYHTIRKENHMSEHILPDMTTSHIREWLRIYGKSMRMNPDIVVSLIDKVEELQQFIVDHAELNLTEAPIPEDWKL